MPQKVFISYKDMDPALIEGIAKLCLEGKIVAIPTETVYGLAVCAQIPAAVERLSWIKKRPSDNPFTYAEDSAEEAIERYFAILTPFGYRLIERFWPGPLTVVYYSRNNHQRCGVRVVAHPVAQEILRAIKQEVFLPSANISGEKEALSAQEVEDIFNAQIDLIVESEPELIYGRPSTVVDLTLHPFKILREGVVSPGDIVDVFLRKRILFVCTGNTCRSPLAQFLFKKYLEEKKPYLKDRVEIISRGILSFKGGSLSLAVKDILREREDILVEGFSSQGVDRPTLLSADLIFTMEDKHNQELLRIEPTIEGRLFSLKKFLPPRMEEDIPDPIGKDYKFYLEVYERIKKAVLELCDWI